MVALRAQHTIMRAVVVVALVRLEVTEQDLAPVDHRLKKVEMEATVVHLPYQALPSPIQVEAADPRLTAVVPEALEVQVAAATVAAAAPMQEWLARPTPGAEAAVRVAEHQPQEYQAALVWS